MTKNFNSSVPGKGSIKADFICDKVLNAALINCRSIKPKLSSLVECFKMNELSVALLNETWFYKTDKQLKKQLADIRDG